MLAVRLVFCEVPWGIERHLKNNLKQERGLDRSPLPGWVTPCQAELLLTQITFTREGTAPHTCCLQPLPHTQVKDVSETPSDGQQEVSGQVMGCRAPGVPVPAMALPGWHWHRCGSHLLYTPIATVQVSFWVRKTPPSCPGEIKSRETAISMQGCPNV